MKKVKGLCDNKRVKEKRKLERKDLVGKGGEKKVFWIKFVM